jgi:hypothetical protein
MATSVGKQPITVHLTYHNDGTVTSKPPNPKFHKGDRVEFVSDRGDKVYVKLNPKAYNPSEFTPSSGPVEVTADPTGEKYPAECGIVKNVNGKDVAYGWIPSGQLSPHMPRIKLSKGIETEP